MIVGELGPESELRFELKGFHQVRHHVVQLDIEFFVLIRCVREVDLDDLAQEIDEFGVGELVHPFLDAHGVDHSHERLSKDDAEDLVGHVKLALAGERDALLQVHGGLFL